MNQRILRWYEMPVKILAALVFLGWSVSANAHVGDHLYGGKAKIVTIKLHDYQGGLRRIISEGYDVAGVDVTSGTVDVVIGVSGMTTFNPMELGLVVSSKDVDPELGPDAGYTTYAELTTILNNYKARFPGILALESIGKSHEGRDIWAIKISDNVGVHEDEPVIFFNAMHHAREVMTTEIAIDLIDQLTSNYNSNSRVKNWVDQAEVWIVPMVNPDGNNKVWNGSSMWRKNTREGYGVDINRNYPYAWGTCNGSSGSNYSDTYRGPSAGSEPETQAMMRLVARVQPTLSISYHSYSELVIYPYGCDGEHSDDRDTVEAIGRQLAGLLIKDSGSGSYDPGTSWELLYAVDGGDIDWYHSEHQVLPYVIEVNSTSQGFQPPFSWRQGTVEKMRAGWAFMLDRLGQSGIRGIVNVNGERAVGGTATVSSLSSDRDKESPVKTYRIKADGTFHVVTGPGMYKISVQYGDAISEQNITVGASRHDLVLNLKI